LICFGDAAIDVGDEDGVGGEFEECLVLFLAGELALFGEKSAGGFGADDEGAADRSMAIADGTVPVGPVDIFELSVADDGDELILVPACVAFGHDGLDLRSDDWPNLGPAVDAILSERAGMFVGADAGAIGIVIELDEVFAPPQKHGVTGDRRVLTVTSNVSGQCSMGPTGSGPVEGTSEIGHLCRFRR
jgi:hypothetical protein